MNIFLLALTFVVTGERFRYLSYNEISDRLLSLSQQYPNILNITDLPVEPPLSCGKSPCRILLASLRGSSKDEYLPQVFLSGALHGNERVGPTTLVVLLEMLCEGYGKDSALTFLVDSTHLLAIPMPNPLGYFLDERTENGLDPNRDFPYRTSSCGKTATSKAIRKVFNDNLVQLTLTFHGGMRAIGYPWGSFNHLIHSQSTVSPDHLVFRDLAQALQKVGGHDGGFLSNWFYPTGPMSDLVYPVDGGMEDWAYGAGFESTGDPITVCEGENTTSSSSNVKAVPFLIETSDQHTPPEKELGERDMLMVGIEPQGHIARNFRLALRAMELTAPRIKWLGLTRENSRWLSKARSTAQYSAKIAVSGCVYYGDLVILRKQGECGSTSDYEEVFRTDPGRTFACHSLFAFSLSDHDLSVSFDLPYSNEGFCLEAQVAFDPQWAIPVQRSDPVAVNGPVSYLARARIDGYKPIYNLSRTVSLLSSHSQGVHINTGPIVTSAVVSEQMLYCQAETLTIIMTNEEISFRSTNDVDQIFYEGCCRGSLSKGESLSCKRCALNSNMRVVLKSNGKLRKDLFECSFSDSENDGSYLFVQVAAVLLGFVFLALVIVKWINKRKIHYDRIEPFSESEPDQPVELFVNKLGRS